MASLATLKLTSAVRPAHIPAVVLRRNKLAKRLWEQAELAKAQQTGTQFSVTKLRSVVQHDTGMRKQVEPTQTERCDSFEPARRRGSNCRKNSETAPATV